KALNFNPATLVLLLRIALPMVVSQGAFAGMIFTDRYFLSQLSPMHMASALGAGVAFFFTISLFNGVLAYANALVAQYLGAREYHKCSLVVSQGVIMSVACAPILLALTFVMRGLFTWMGHAPEQAALEETYYTIMMGCSVLVLLKVCFASFFAGTARTHVVMFCDV